MKAKISVIHAGGEAASELARYARVVEGLGELSGSDVVVVGAELERGAEAIRVHAPAATVLVVAEPVADACQRLYEATLFPRTRVIGVPDPHGLAAAARSIVLGDGGEHEVVALVDGSFGPCRARLGARGISELL